MRLKRLSVSRLPGIDSPFAIEASGVGVHVIFGPNGIGKSSICRAVESLYWEDRGSSQRTSVAGEFELDGEIWWAEREGSRVRWQHGGEDSYPPALPPSHSHRCFFLRLRDLIDPSPDGTRDVATEIRRQMSGGFDLDEIASGLFGGIGARHGRGERRDFDNAAVEVREAEGKQSGLQRRAEELESLRQRLAGAASASRRLTHVDRALGLAGRLEEHASIIEEMSVFPSGLSGLSGQEDKQVGELQARADECTGRVRDLERQREVARDNQGAVGLPAPLTDADLKTWRAHADELGRIELALQAARNELAGCRRELESALFALGGGDPGEVDLDLPDDARLFEFLRTLAAHGARVRAIDERLRLLAHVDQPGDSHHDSDKLREAVDHLRSWLRSPVSGSYPQRIRDRRIWILLTIVVLISGVALAVFVDPMLALIAAAAVGGFLALLLPDSVKSSPDGRELARKSFEESGIEGPETWDSRSVGSRLRELENEIAGIDARSQRARDREVEKQALQSELSGLAGEEKKLEARRQELGERLKLDAIPPDAELVDLARALDQYRAARARTSQAEGKVDELEKRYSGLLSELGSALEQHGVPGATDAANAKGLVNDLADRNARLVRAIYEEKQTTGQLEQARRDLDAALEGRKAIYERAALTDGDMPGLAALLKALPQYQDIKTRAERLASQIELDRTELQRAGEEQLVDLDRQELEQMHNELSRKADEADELRDEIAEINARVSEARSGRNLQDLIARREAARIRLRDRRDEALFAAAGDLLIRAVEDEYEQAQLPRVLERARAHFSTFTHHSYELQLGKDTSVPRLFARDLRSGEGLGLEELSDGTRAQLLLAARIAFAEEVEQGKVMPLFLDEALDQSDPARFAAIVRSLGRIGKDQARQIFYLTSDPHDTDRIRNALIEESCEIAAVIDLGLIRNKAESVRNPESIRVEPRPGIPAPEAKPAEEYGVTIGVPMFQPALGHADQHLFYLLTDDLGTLHELLVRGIVRVGQWKTVAGTELARKVGSGRISEEEITQRVQLLEVFCGLWSQGRGQLVDRHVLETSKALSDRYVDDVVAIAAELGGDPTRLMAAIGKGKDPRLKGFRKTSYVSLEKYLRDNSYLDDRPLLDEDELRLRALASPAASRLPDGVASDCLHRWWTLARRGEESRPCLGAP